MKYPDFKKAGGESYKKGGFKISGPCKSAAKSKFDVYPSAYANAWGVRCTKAGGPGSMGKSKKEEGGPAEIDKKEQRLFRKKSKAAAKYKKAVTKRDDARYYKDSPLSMTGAKREPSKRKMERLEGRYRKRGAKLKTYQDSKKKKGGFPDLTGDGKVTRADILKGRGVIKKRGGEKKDETIGKKERGRGRSRKGVDVNVQSSRDVVKKAPKKGKSTKYEVQVTKTRTKTKTVSRARARRMAKRKNYQLD